MSDKGSYSTKKWLFIVLGLMISLVGILNIVWSQVTITKGLASEYKLECSQLIIGTSCSGTVHRQGGGMCDYKTSFYALSSEKNIKNGDTELYMPLNTCSATVAVFTPIVDLTFARVLSVISVLAGLLLTAVNYSQIRSAKAK